MHCSPSLRLAAFGLRTVCGPLSTQKSFSTSRSASSNIAVLSRSLAHKVPIPQAQCMIQCRGSSGDSRVLSHGVGRFPFVPQNLHALVTAPSPAEFNPFLSVFRMSVQPFDTSSASSLASGTPPSYANATRRTMSAQRHSSKWRALLAVNRTISIPMAWTGASSPEMLCTYVCIDSGVGCMSRRRMHVIALHRRRRVWHCCIETTRETGVDQRKYPLPFGSSRLQLLLRPIYMYLCTVLSLRA